MIRELELWLDESGDFQPDSQRDSRRNPSLVGGILLEKGNLTEQELRELAYPAKFRSLERFTGDEPNPHATRMDRTAMRELVLPALEEICRCGGKLVFFENRERIDTLSNRELYLRVLASGLIQLLRKLASEGQFALEVSVALRVDPEAEKDALYIDLEEYRKELFQYLDTQDFHMPAGCRVSLAVLNARQEHRLYLADYACNARLCRDSGKFDEKMRQRFHRLCDQEYFWSVYAKTSENYIRAQLAETNISAALLELYLSYSRFDHMRLLKLCLDRFGQLSYRLQRLHLQRFIASVRAYVAKETDFERSELLLKNLLSEFFPALKKRNGSIQTDESEFWLHLALADMYLREGDVLQAGPVMDALQELVITMGYRIENLQHLYFYNDKRALYQINCFEYEAAVETIGQTISAMEDFIGLFPALEPLARFFDAEKSPPQSEYLGNAYCMKVYAEMFLQREDPAIYELRLRQDTEKALSCYRYPGELERNLQYRAHVEMERGMCRDALNWLLMTQSLCIMNEDITGASILYLKKAWLEDPLSRAYYMMYYVEIMEKAAVLGDRQLSDAMHQAILKEKRLFSEFFSLRSEGLIRSDTGRPVRQFRDLFSSGAEAQRRYHPLEIVLWKYGSYIAATGGSLKAAAKHWERAIHVCDENPDYLALRLVGMAILLEQFSWMTSKDVANAIQSSLKVRASSVLKLGEIPRRMGDFVREVLEFASGPLEPDAGKRALFLSKRIAF